MELENRDGLTVAELIDVLSQHPADAIVEMSIIAPVGEGDDDITVDRYHIDGVMPWRDEDEDDMHTTAFVLTNHRDTEAQSL